MKTIFRAFTVVIASGFVLISCAHHKDVRPGAEGVHRVLIQTSDKEDGAREALSQANHFCGKSKKTAAIVEEDQKYTGDMEEKDYQTGKKVSKVAKVVGGTAWALGGKNESALGGIVGLGGTAADAALGDGYTVSMKFKCM